MTYNVVFQTISRPCSIAVEPFEDREEAMVTFRFACEFNPDVLVSVCADNGDGSRDVIAESLSWRNLHENAEQAFRDAGWIV